MAHVRLSRGSRSQRYSSTALEGSSFTVCSLLGIHDAPGRCIITDSRGHGLNSPSARTLAARTSANPGARPLNCCPRSGPDSSGNRNWVLSPVLFWSSRVAASPWIRGARAQLTQCSVGRCPLLLQPKSSTAQLLPSLRDRIQRKRDSGPKSRSVWRSRVAAPPRIRGARAQLAQCSVTRCPHLCQP